MSVRIDSPRIATAEALPEIAGLLERALPRTRPWALDLGWQYLESPSGPARYVNAYTEAGALVAHYAVMPIPPLAEPPAQFVGTYFSTNTAVDPAAPVPGLMVATGRAMFRALQQEGPTLVLGVANENSIQGFVRMLGFLPLGRLSLTAFPPGTLPRLESPRALTSPPAHLSWRTRRPGVTTYGDPARGALTVRMRHRGIPLDVVLATGLPANEVADLDLACPARWVPRLYAGFGGRVRGGVTVPDRFRPSPLEYIVRVPGDKALTDGIAAHLTERRFEFLDFDVV